MRFHKNSEDHRTSGDTDMFYTSRNAHYSAHSHRSSTRQIPGSWSSLLPWLAAHARIKPAGFLSHSAHTGFMRNEIQELHAFRQLNCSNHSHCKSRKEPLSRRPSHLLWSAARTWIEHAGTISLLRTEFSKSNKADP